MEKKTAVFIAMGFECVGLITVCILIGRYLDEKYAWKGMGAAAGAFIGLAAWFTHMVVLLKNLAKNTDSGHTGPQ